MDEMLSVADVAERIGRSERTIQRWLQEGYFPNAFKKGPGRTSPYVIPEDDLDAFIESLRQARTPTQTANKN